MPIYEFLCNDCEEVTAELRKIGDDKPAICSKCGSGNTRKKLSLFANHNASEAGSCAPSGGT